MPIIDPKHAESRLLEELPQAERSKILRMKAEPQPEEIYEVCVCCIPDINSSLFCVRQILYRKSKYIIHSTDIYLLPVAEQGTPSHIRYGRTTYYGGDTTYIRRPQQPPLLLYVVCLTWRLRVAELLHSLRLNERLPLIAKMVVYYC